MADQLTLTASTDRAIGSRSSRRLRKEGKVPAVVYGAGDDPTPISVEWSDLRAALTTPAGMNALITLEFNDDERLTIVKDMQRDPVRRNVTHVDFIIIDRNVALEVEVPIVLENIDGDNLKELVVDQQLFSLPISALPGSIPNELVVDCSSLTLDDPIRAESITLPSGVELNIDPEDAIVTASLPVIEVAEPVEGEEGEDGEATADGGDADASGGDDAESGDDAGDDA
ncbi:50S ribosomal protein L25 [Actinospongicola halichondriae]|uniref:50S ribosomal protein L25 n=1 Tax=Actinospongicola halichondriae TaxID=3236844 RepID=UPI003D5D3B5E